MYQNNYNGVYNPQNMFQQQPKITQPIQQQLGLKGRPVSSLEEARAAAVDFDGSIFFFPDLASNRIYTKQINVDGTASLKMYEYKEIPIESTSTYVTRAEFDQTLTEIKNSLAQLTPKPMPIPKDEKTAAPAKKTTESSTADMIAKQF